MKHGDKIRHRRSRCLTWTVERVNKDGTLHVWRRTAKRGLQTRTISRPEEYRLCTATAS